MCKDLGNNIYDEEIKIVNSFVVTSKAGQIS